MLRVALIGCGAHSESAHARPLAHFVAQRPGPVELAAACDLDRTRAERFCREYGFASAYRDVGEMLDRVRPGAVVSVLPIEAIPQVSGELLRRGVSCSIEKLTGSTIEEVRTLAETARTTGAHH